MSRLYRDPLVHFTLAAALIFALFHFIAPRDSGRETIHISRADLERLAALYASESGALPEPDEMRALAADYVETTALAREARRLGLEDGDIVVERRLAQKMRFMVDDLTELPDPDDAALKAWFEANAGSFARPALYSFEHVYFRDPSDPRIKTTLASLAGSPAGDWRGMGDSFMLQRQYGELPAREITRLFGAGFAARVEALPLGEAWQGPVTSALGVHLVRVTKRIAAETPTFEAVKGDVLLRWREEERRRANARQISDIVSRYTVSLEGAGK